MKIMIVDDERDVEILFRQHQLDFDFGQKVHRVFAATVDFGVAFLAAKTFDFGDGHALDADFAQGIFNFLQLEWLNDRFDFFHNVGF